MTEARRICTLCEATCGIRVTLDERRIVTIRGDEDDPFSRGFICPKAYGLKDLEEDPDRLRQPLRRRGNGFETIGWDEAFAEAIERLWELRAASGPDAIATYLGNPSAHSLHAMVYGPVLQRALGTKQRYSASSADQLPKMVSAGLMFGRALSIPVPDVDRCQYLLVLGANPLVSNGSLMTAPDMPRRLRELRARGGKLVVIDPRKTETARLADEHHFIRPGTDAAFLLAIVHVLFAEDRMRLGRATGLCEGIERVRNAVAEFAPERVAAFTGIAPDVTRRIALELSTAPSAACYGRIGTTCQEFGTLASWAVDLVNVLSGNLDAPGGAMFTRPAANRGGAAKPSGKGRGVKLGRYQSRVKKLPEMFGELPVATLADEILDGEVRGLVSFAGNPALSAPNGARLTRALEKLETYVAIDFYVNETTRHAHLILPPPSPLERDTYDLALYQLAVRNVAKYSSPTLPKPEGQPDEWEILLTLAKGMLGMKDVALPVADANVLSVVVQSELEGDLRWPDLRADEVIAALGTTPGPARILDLFLRTGPYGDGFGRNPGGLSLEELREHPEGIDLGALQSELPGVLGTASGCIELAPDMVLADLPRLRARLDRPSPPLTLIGRRHLRSNNSWMHNLRSLVKGPERCLLLIHPDDAKAHSLAEGDRCQVTSRVGDVTCRIQITDELMPGVVSLPHGWGHDEDGVLLQVAKAHAGVNVNRLSDDAFLDIPSANAAFNGVPVTLARVP